MQNVNFGQQSYPAYPNCFDLLTTHGILAEDAMEYMTGTPSPYLQNYVAQRGGVPSLPGQMMPDNLPGLPKTAPLPVGDVYQPSSANLPTAINSNIPKASELNSKTFEKHNKIDNIKKIVAGVLITGLAVLGIVKGKGLISKVYQKFFGPQTAAQAAQTTQTSQAAATATQAATTAQQTTNGGFLSKLKNHKKAIIGTTAGVLAALGLAKLFGHKQEQAIYSQAAYDPNQGTDMSTIGAQELQPEEPSAQIQQTIEQPVQQQVQQSAPVQTAPQPAMPQAQQFQPQPVSVPVK